MIKFAGVEGLVGFVGSVIVFGLTGFTGFTGFTGVTGAGVMHSFPFQTSPVLQTMQVTPLK